ncbi:MAG: hypothetical protein OHK0057_31880 [Thermoflexibacter sp.]
MKNRILTTLFIISIAISCKDTTKETSSNLLEMSSVELFNLSNNIGNKQATLEQSEIINIPIDSVSLNHSLYPVYYDADTIHYYITANANQHSLDFYDINKRILTKRVYFKKEGAEGVPDLRYFFIKNMDSVFVLSRNYKQIVLINSKGNLLARTNIHIKDGDDMAHSLSCPIDLRDSFLIVPKLKPVTPMEMVGTNVIAGINIYTGKVIEYELKLPPAFEKKQAPIGSYLPSFALLNDKINVRFGLLSTIYQYDIKTEQTTVIPLKSKFQEQAITLSEYSDFIKMASEVGEKEDIEKASYQNLMYDSYRQVYYSVFFEGIDMINKASGKKNSYDDKPISIIIADKDFRYLGEKRLGVGYFRNFLVTKDGLLVSNAHPKNPHYQEDVLSFTLFKLKYQE